MLVCCPTLVEAARDVLAGVNAKRTASGLLTAAGWKSGGLVCWQLAGFRFGLILLVCVNTLGHRAADFAKIAAARTRLGARLALETRSNHKARAHSKSQRFSSSATQ